MRLYLKTTSNVKTVPFSYQQNLTGVLHKWLGSGNTEHGKISMYSFSSLRGSKITDGGLNFQQGASWFISFADEMKIRKIVASILADPEMFCGMKVIDVDIEETPDMSKKELFFAASPIFIKRSFPEKHEDRHYTYEDAESNSLLKETLLNKMRLCSIPVDDTLEIRFDISYNKKKIKLVSYRNIKNKTSVCPIIIKGKPETKAFAWNVGIGNCTGIGFGAIY
ncbi:MAG: CRISPR-associated endoribonuclease Cas6 [Elusimicrobiales bacterium]|nr:CRISPR-associated endoribonuclease Cas6 [Elusimicrobiales bacterium]